MSIARAYTKQLRNDSSFALVPFITAVFVIPSIILIVFNFSRFWYFALVLLGSVACSQLVLRMIRRQQQVLAGTLFVYCYLILVTLIISREWSPGSILPVLYAIFIVVSSTMITPTASFEVWGVSIVLLLVGLGVSGNLSLSNLGAIVASVVVNGLLSVVAFLSSTDWQLAVEAVSIIQDRAQRRRDELFDIQQQLARTNRVLQASNEALDEARKTAVLERDLRTRFMNNVSHELRTPLNAIVNFSHILAEAGQGDVNQSQIEYLKRIEQSGWHSLNILNDLLDMAQIQSGEFKLTLKPTNLHAICEYAMNNAQGLIMGKDIQLIRDYPDEWPLVRVDPTRFQQVLLNLLGNAAKYTEQGHIALRVRPDNKMLKLIVEDSGLGIAPEHFDTIFQEFRQLDEKPARSRTGTGLGLPITKHLVERQNGTLSVKSQVDVGSHFMIALPIYSPTLNGVATPSDGELSNNPTV